MRAFARRDAECVFHRQLSRLFEWPARDVWRIDFEFSGEGRGRAEFCLRNSMTRAARNAIARKRSVLAIRLIRQRVNHAVLERFACVSFELALAHYPVTAIAGVVKEAGLRRVQTFFRFELCMKDWIAPGETH